MGARIRDGFISDGDADPICVEAEAHDRAEVAECVDAYAHHTGARRRLEGLFLSDFRVSLPQILARGDKNTMQHSIETRVPFLDGRLVRLCVNLPLEHRIEPHRKNPLVEIARRHLPRDVVERPKIGFNFDVGEYLRASANESFLRDGVLRDLLGGSEPGWQDEVAVDPYRGAMLLWTAEIWARLFVEGQSPSSVEGDLLRRGRVD